MKYKIYFNLKRGIWTTEQQSGYFSPMFLFQKWLGFPEDVWAWWLLMHWLQLQFTPCEALPSVWIGFAWQYSQACGHPCCLCTFSYPISSFQSTLPLHGTLSTPLGVSIKCKTPVILARKTQNLLLYLSLYLHSFLFLSFLQVHLSEMSSVSTGNPEEKSLRLTLFLLCGREEEFWVFQGDS